MLLKIFGILEASAVTERRRNCRAMSEGELLRLESAVGENYARAAPSKPCVTVTTSNVSSPAVS